MNSPHNSVLLYGYSASPFAIKIQNVLVLKKIPYDRVNVPNTLPRPEITELLGIGYRKIPLCAIGNDVYCDTSLIASALDRRFPASQGFGTLFPPRKRGGTADTGLIKALSKHWVDNVVFPLAPALLPWERFPKAFVDDRSALASSTINVAGILASREKTISALASHLFNSLLSKNNSWMAENGYLTQSSPSLADISVHFVFGWARSLPNGQKLFGSFPRSLKWLDSVNAYLEELKAGLPVPQKIPASDAASRILSAEFEPLDVVGFDTLEATRLGLKLGMQVALSPEDNGRNYPTVGKLVALNREEFAKAKAAATSQGKAAKKKKWSKGKVKDKAQHAVVLDKATYDRIMKEVPTFRFISQSILIERLKINGSLARVAIRHLEKEGTIKRIVHHASQLVYSIDVGTGSARAALISATGDVAASATVHTLTWRDSEDHRIFEQSTTNIWNAIASATKQCLSTSNIPPEAVKGIGFDATCSLAVADFNGTPLQVTKGSDLGLPGERNIILWADHRAEKQADIINASGSVVLDYVGGTMSLEMEIPKILWLKQHMDGNRFSSCQFFDLPDFLTYLATSSRTRSCCSLTCKCSFLPSASGWDASFFTKIGLEELIQDGAYPQLGGAHKDVLTAGLAVGSGLSKKAAEELGLCEGTPVGSGVIDAYAGWLGTVAVSVEGDHKPTLSDSQHRLAAVAGTSTCHLIQSPEGVFVNGVWGPYKDALFRGWWMNEGGQSSTGQLIDFVLTTHPAYNTLVETAKEQQKNIYAILIETLERMRIEEGAETLTELTKDMHLYPDFHGNRSPLADPRMRGALSGLVLSSSLTDLARRYYLALQAIALQTRHIIDTLESAGHNVQLIALSGGQAVNAALVSLLANTCAKGVVLPPRGAEGGAVVRGAAMLGRFAAEAGDTAKAMTEETQGNVLWEIMVDMTPSGTLVAPNASQKEDRLLKAKYKIFLETIEIQRRWRQEMEEAAK
ncbi:hypothetical protein MIND_00728100 [Mycena indigotica]|uniref:Uncharacterized protein n=1 Tax=Mycena indigotica TaxID=2126181 RepID=A0A8H6SLJ0_9AGAR|nr:uncharacterized protein MIND_00728100 [Mycena indigotica]KAF7301626.1 hypothetical protein MIND_00728100 [Mycena indigotica]